MCFKNIHIFIKFVLTYNTVTCAKSNSQTCIFNNIVNKHYLFTLPTFHRDKISQDKLKSINEYYSEQIIFGILWTNGSR